MPIGPDEGGMRYEAPGAERPAARPESTTARRGAPADLPDVVPGFRAVRLPLEDSILPTSFATRSDGGVVLTTLSYREGVSYYIDAALALALLSFAATVVAARYVTRDRGSPR